MEPFELTPEDVRDWGREVVELHHDEWVKLARREAVRISARLGSVSIVDLRAWAEKTGKHPRDPLAYSAVFKGKEWVPTGKRVKSRHLDGHAREVKCWRYRSTVY